MNSTVIFPDYTFYSINLLPFWYVWADSIMLFFTFHNIRHYVSLEKKLTKKLNHVYQLPWEYFYLENTLIYTLLHQYVCFYRKHLSIAKKFAHTWNDLAKMVCIHKCNFFCSFYSFKIQTSPKKVLLEKYYLLSKMVVLRHMIWAKVN